MRVVDRPQQHGLLRFCFEHIVAELQAVRLSSLGFWLGLVLRARTAGCAAGSWKSLICVQGRGSSAGRLPSFEGGIGFRGFRKADCVEVVRLNGNLLESNRDPNHFSIKFNHYNKEDYALYIF